MLIHTLLRHEATLEDLASEMDTSAYHAMVNNMGHLFLIDPITNHEVIILNTASRSVSNGSIGKMGPWPGEQPIPNKEGKNKTWKPGQPKWRSG